MVRLEEGKDAKIIQDVPRFHTEVDLASDSRRFQCRGPALPQNLQPWVTIDGAWADP